MSVLSTPYANILPPLAPAEFDALKESIEADGVRDPIIIDEQGNILDGNHRYRISPDAPTRVVSGLSDAGKRAFVIAVNLQRRNLSSKDKEALRDQQRAIAVSLRSEGLTQQKIGTMLGMARNTITGWLSTTNVGSDNSGTAPAVDLRFKTTQADKDEIVRRVDAGERQSVVATEFGISQSSVSDVVVNARKKRGDLPTPHHAGSFINIPAGMTAEALCRKGLALETGTTIDAVAKQLNIDRNSYRKMRDVVLLADRNDLLPDDAEKIAQALVEMNKTRRVSHVDELISPIVDRVWGGSPHTTKASLKRIEQFGDSISVVCRSCSTISEICVPHLDNETANGVVAKLRAAERHLTKLRKQIEETYK